MFVLLKEAEKISLPETRQAFEIAAAQPLD